MFVPVSIGNCRIAIAVQAAAVKEKYDSDRALISERSYNQLYEGAVHNGLKPSQENLDQMREMSQRDVEHMMEGHPAKGVLEKLSIMSAMLDYTESLDEDQVVIDHEEFELLHKHFPTTPKD